MTLKIPISGCVSIKHKIAQIEIREINLFKLKQANFEKNNQTVHFKKVFALSVGSFLYRNG